MFRVYHHDPTSGKGGFGYGTEPVWPEDYVYVGIASAAQTLDEAYQLTNSIDQPWFQSVFVQPADDRGRYRSTSVWDVIVDTKNSVVYRVEKAGFKEISKWTGNEETIMRQATYKH